MTNNIFEESKDKTPLLKRNSAYSNINRINSNLNLANLSFNSNKSENYKL